MVLANPIYLVSLPKRPFIHTVLANPCYLLFWPTPTIYGSVLSYTVHLTSTMCIIGSVYRCVRR